MNLTKRFHGMASSASQTLKVSCQLHLQLHLKTRNGFEKFSSMIAKFVLT